MDITLRQKTNSVAGIYPMYFTHNCIKEKAKEDKSINFTPFIRMNFLQMYTIFCCHYWLFGIIATNDSVNYVLAFKSSVFGKPKCAYCCWLPGYI